MTISPLHIASTSLTLAVSVLACVCLADDLDGTDIRPLPDPAVQVDVEIEQGSPLPEPRRRAAGIFDLGVSERIQVRNYAETSGLECEVRAMGRRLRCEGPKAELKASFDREGQLSRLDMRRWHGAETAEAAFTSAVDLLETQVGPATSSVRSDRFVASAWERTERGFDYVGYEATVTATHFGERGLQVRELYVAK